jgi:hypothetical protein
VVELPNVRSLEEVAAFFEAKEEEEAENSVDRSSSVV